MLRTKQRPASFAPGAAGTYIQKRKIRSCAGTSFSKLGSHSSSGCTRLKHDCPPSLGDRSSATHPAAGQPCGDPGGGVPQQDQKGSLSVEVISCAHQCTQQSKVQDQHRYTIKQQLTCPCLRISAHRFTALDAAEEKLC